MTELDPAGLRRPGDVRQPAVPFEFEGRRLVGLAGEPIAAALHAQGVQILGRSMKYHRPRGLYCVADACPSCSMRVNGLPGVRTCSTPLRADDVVSRERGTPSADRDLLGAADRLSRFTPAGFQYRRFRRSPRLFRVWERILARLAASGEIPDPAAARALPEQSSWSVEDADVVVVGGGVAGLSAALAATESGARVLLVERLPELGGHARLGVAEENEAPGAGTSPPDRESGSHAAGLERLATAETGIDVRVGATAVGWYAEDVLAVADGTGMVEVRARAVILATGAHERPLAFSDNDRPGVMLGGGVERLLHSHGLRPGHRAVVATSEDSGYDLASRLHSAGVQVVAVADLRAAPGAGALAVADGLRGDETNMLTGATVTQALGRSKVTGAALAGLAGTSTEFACDTIVIANGRRPARELLFQRAAVGGLELQVPDGVRAAVTDPGLPVVEGWWLAGGVGGTETVGAAIRAGDAAGRAAAESLA